MRALLLLFLPVLLIAAWILSSLRAAEPGTVEVAPQPWTEVSFGFILGRLLSFYGNQSRISGPFLPTLPAVSDS